MLNEIRELGFEYAELSHGIRVSLLQGIFDAVDKHEIKISSLHNFCPLPLGVNHAAPNIFQFSALRSRERESALRHTLRTIETAARVGAQVVVLHLGSVDMQDYTDRLRKLAREGKQNNEHYKKLCSEALLKREEAKKSHLDNVFEILHKVAQEAKKNGVKLGIENREGIEEIPFETDFELFFREFNDSTVVYWHDTGHAQIKENLGFIHHRIHLEAMQKWLFGLHIHDVKFPDIDHTPPGMGEIDFAALRPLIKPEHLKVFELSPALDVEHIKVGVSYLKSLWGNQ
ncbi:MAG: sugar phosphate isomerase/epimerase family protein [Verrucomicrobiia bacterium]